MVILLIVPLKIDYSGLNMERGYGFIFSHHNPSYAIDIVRLIIEIAIVTIVTVLVYVLRGAAVDWWIMFNKQLSDIIRYIIRQEVNIRKFVKYILFVLFAITVFLVYINGNKNQSTRSITQVNAKAESLGGNTPAKARVSAGFLSAQNHSFSNYSKHVPPILSARWVKLGAQGISKYNTESIYYASG
jgi:preprotein translocase subunit SecG